MFYRYYRNRNMSTWGEIRTENNGRETIDKTRSTRVVYAYAQCSTKRTLAGIWAAVDARGAGHRPNHPPKCTNTLTTMVGSNAPPPLSLYAARKQTKNR